MASFKGKFESSKQDWETPQSLFDDIDREFNFTFDAAASISNAKTERFFTQEDDALRQDWPIETYWLNPPYGAKSGTLKQWVEKAYYASKKGSTVVMLIPARTNTNWFHDICLSKAEVRFIRGRPKFGGADHGLPQPLCYVIFRPAKVTKPTTYQHRDQDDTIPDTSLLA